MKMGKSFRIRTRNKSGACSCFGSPNHPNLSAFSRKSGQASTRFLLSIFIIPPSKSIIFPFRSVIAAHLSRTHFRWHALLMCDPNDPLICSLFSHLLSSIIPSLFVSWQWIHPKDRLITVQLSVVSQKFALCSLETFLSCLAAFRMMHAIILLCLSQIV